MTDDKGQSIALRSALTELLQEGVTRLPIVEERLVLIKKRALEITPQYGLTLAAAYILAIDTEIIIGFIMHNPQSLKDKGILAGLGGILPLYALIGIEHYRLPADLIASAVGQQIDAVQEIVSEIHTPRLQWLDESAELTLNSFFEYHELAAQADILNQAGSKVFYKSAVPNRRPSQLELKLMVQDPTGIRLLEHRQSEIIQKAVTTLEVARDAQIKPIVRATGRNSPDSIARYTPEIVGFEAGLEMYKSLLQRLAD